MNRWLLSPNDGRISPVSGNTSSIGHFSGSDWTTDSSWLSFDSMIQSVFYLQATFPTSSIVDVHQQSRGLSQPPQSCGTLNTRRTPEEENGETARKETNKNLTNLKRKQSTNKHSILFNSRVNIRVNGNGSKEMSRIGLLCHGSNLHRFGIGSNALGLTLKMPSSRETTY